MKNRAILVRIIFDGIILFSLVSFPYPITIGLTVLGTILFPNFFEVLFLGFVFDLLYGRNLDFWSSHLGLISGLLISVLSLLGRKVLLVNWR